MARRPNPAATKRRQPVVTVQTNALKLATLHRYVQGYGTVEPAPATADAPPPARRWRRRLRALSPKSPSSKASSVEKGDLLVELNSGAMTYELAEQELARQKQLFAQQNTSQRNLQNAEAQLALLRVTAPLSGTVVRVNVKPGQAVDVNDGGRGSDGFEPAGRGGGNPDGGGG